MRKIRIIIMNVQDSQDLSHLYIQWYSANQKKEQILQHLERQNFSVQDRDEIVKKYYQFKDAKRSHLGWILMLIGGIVGLISCILTILDFMPSLRNLWMYGLTSLGVIIAFYGCYLVMERTQEEE